MNETPKQTAIRALENMRGDDLERAKRAFRNMSETELDSPYGMNDKTPRQLMAGWQEHHDRVNRAIVWVKSRPDGEWKP